VFLNVAAFVVPLGFDTLAVALLLGLRGIRPFRPALTFAVFEAAMPLIGILLGRLVGDRFETPAVVLGGLVLLGVALYMLKEALEDEDETAGHDFTTLGMAAIAGFGISMDELAIGFPMGTSGLPIPQTIGAIAAQAFVVTYVGIFAGSRVGARLGQHTSKISAMAAAAGFGVLGLYLIAERFAPGLPKV
jgi:putative Mn2+ efflux pump MntP